MQNNHKSKISFKEWYKKLLEVGTDAIVGSCKGGPDFQVQGACSDLKKKKSKK